MFYRGDEFTLNNIDPKLPHTPENYTIEAICDGGQNSLKISKIKSKALIGSIERYCGDLQQMVKDLNEKFTNLGQHIDPLCSASHDDPPLFSIEIVDLTRSTNFGHRINYIKRNIEDNAEKTKELLNNLIGSDDMLDIADIYNPFHYMNFKKDFNLDFDS